MYSSQVTAETLYKMSPERTDYFLESEEEISRLSNQHDVIKDEMGGLILAPIDLSQPLRVLDSATADGMCYITASESDELLTITYNS